MVDVSGRRRSELTGARFGRNGRAALAVECAAAHDLAAATAAQLSRAQQWADHANPDGTPGPASSAKRAIREGRLLLHRLGAWPWAHADRGRLHEHPGWWANDAFVGPLRAWLAVSWARLAFDEYAKQRDALALEPVETRERAASDWALRVLERHTVDLIILAGAEGALD
jgi:hypothetical protein